MIDWIDGMVIDNVLAMWSENKCNISAEARVLLRLLHARKIRVLARSLFIANMRAIEMVPLYTLHLASAVRTGHTYPLLEHESPDHNTMNRKIDLVSNTISLSNGCQENRKSLPPRAGNE